MKLCIIIPMYNEEAIAEKSVGSILHYAEALPFAATLLVVNDGSRDGTKRILADLQDRYDPTRFVTISHASNQGYGAALRTGIRYAVTQQFDYAVFMDSDLTNHPRYLKDFCAKILEGWDYIKATRYSKGGSVEGVPRRHRILSLVGNTVARHLYGLPLTDLTNGFRAVRVSILKEMELRENHFAVIMEELAQARLLTKSFCEIPYILTSRESGRSRFSYSLRTCCRYLSYAVKSRLTPPYSKKGMDSGK
jgi:dolichol-phosphate mannosyltransferase